MNDDNFKASVIAFVLTIGFILLVIWINGDSYSQQTGWTNPDGTPDVGTDCGITGQNGC